MNSPPQTKSQQFRMLAIVLYGISFVTPDFGSGNLGFNAFLATPVDSIGELVYAFQWSEWHRAVLAMALMIGWLANFTILFRLPRIATLFAIASPWVLFFGMMFLSYRRGVETHWPDTWVLKFIPFYPWALGIGLIHLSRLMEPTPKDYPRTSWVGF
jgi:hypothetical protein